MMRTMSYTSKKISVITTIFLLNIGCSGTEEQTDRRLSESPNHAKLLAYAENTCHYLATCAPDSPLKEEVKANRAACKVSTFASYKRREKEYARFACGKLLFDREVECYAGASCEQISDPDYGKKCLEAYMVQNCHLTSTKGDPNYSPLLEPINSYCQAVADECTDERYVRRCTDASKILAMLSIEQKKWEVRNVNAPTVDKTLCTVDALRNLGECLKKWHCEPDKLSSECGINLTEKAAPGNLRKHDSPNLKQAENKCYSELDNTTL